MAPEYIRAAVQAHYGVPLARTALAYCAVEPDCPYSAARLYLGMVRSGRTGWPVSVITDSVTDVTSNS